MKLNEYFKEIEKYGFNVPDFCKCRKISQISIYNYLKGKTPHISMARKLEKATKGCVTLRDLGISS